MRERQRRKESDEKRQRQERQSQSASKAETETEPETWCQRVREPESETEAETLIAICAATDYVHEVLRTMPDAGRPSESGQPRVRVSLDLLTHGRQAGFPDPLRMARQGPGASLAVGGAHGVWAGRAPSRPRLAASPLFV